MRQAVARAPGQYLRQPRPAGRDQRRALSEYIGEAGVVDGKGAGNYFDAS